MSANIWPANLALRIISSTWLVIWSLVAAVELLAVVEEAKKGKSKFLTNSQGSRATLQLRLVLLGNSLFNLVTFALVAFSAFAVPFPSAQGCDALGWSKFFRARVRVCVLCRETKN